MKPYVKILGIDYKIELHEEINDNGVLGLINYNTMTIKIKKGLPEHAQKKVLVHECVHAMLDILKLHDLNRDEDIVDTLAVGFLSIVENNPFLSIVENHPFLSENIS